MHTSVLLNEVIEFLDPQDDKTYIDATFGSGGYSNAILNKAKCSVLAFDRDKDTEKFFLGIKNDFPNNIKYFNSRFSLMKEALFNDLPKNIDGIVFDLGVSSMQLADEKRGFSFLKDGPLDMRMSVEDNLITASVIVNTFYEKKIADIIFEYGDESASRKIAKAIINARQKKPIITTHELANIIRSVFPRRHYKTDPATKTFQALRIFINSELKELENGIDVASEIISPGGKIIIVSFHSLEDAIVKNKFKNLKQTSNFEIINKKVIAPTNDEIKKNRRSRSAKLRAIKKNMRINYEN